MLCHHMTAAYSEVHLNCLNMLFMMLQLAIATLNIGSCIATVSYLAIASYCSGNTNKLAG